MIVYVDVETYYSDEYSLRKMTVPEYVNSPLFECIGWGVAVDDEEPRWLSPDEFKALLRTLPPDVTMVSHNALFDMFVLSHRFDYTPGTMLDTLGMSRSINGAQLRSHSLDAVASFYKLPGKTGALANAKGMGRQAVLAAPWYPQYVEYAKHDVFLAREIFKNMRPMFPDAEVAVMDTLIRMAVKPRFELDMTLLHEHLNEIRVKKETLLAQCGLQDRKSLMSNEKFAMALRQLGVTPPMKTSPITTRETYAFSKTDKDFLALTEHENEEVQALVAARLGLKSTLEETRTERMIGIGQSYTYRNSNPMMPMPLKYSGAHTHRFSGDWKINVQNLTRGSNLRKALGVRPGFKVVAADASQIEARLLATLAGATNLVDAFRRGEDVYSQFASSVFGQPVTKKTHPVERFIGKTAILGLGYGLGYVKFNDTLKVQSRNQIGKVVDLGAERCKDIVHTYRNLYARIPMMWERMENYIGRMTNRDTLHVEGPLTIGFERIVLPNGHALFYHDLQRVRTVEFSGWEFTYGGVRKKLYGGKLTENVVQALARIHVMEAAMRVEEKIDQHWEAIARYHSVRDDFRPALQVHDELVYVVPEQFAQTMLTLLITEMRREPDWLAGAPFDAEGGVGDNYGEVK